MICLVPNCTGSQACPLCRVYNSGVSTDLLPFWRSASNAAPVSGWARVSANIPADWVSCCRRRVDRWSEETLDTVAGSEINSEPHCNRGLGRHCSYLRGIWHLSHSFVFCLSFLLLPLPLCLLLSTFTTGFLTLHSHVWCSTKVISTYSLSGSDGLIFSSCIVTLVVLVGWHSRFSSPQQPAHLTSGTQEGL